VQHPHAAGIDIGSRSHWVCVGFTAEAASCLIQEFPAHTAGLQAIAAFLREHQVTTVALESTGVYWIPLFELLQAEGFEVLLVDPSYSHQLRGRPKTDRRYSPMGIERNRSHSPVTALRTPARNYHQP
jgi:transposase